MYYLFKFPYGEKIHATVTNPDSGHDIHSLCGVREVAMFAYQQRDVTQIWEEDLCKRCFIPYRLETFRQMKAEAREKLADPLDSLSADELRAALKRVRREVEDHGLYEDEFEKILQGSVSGTLTVVFELHNLNPKVRDFMSNDLRQGFLDEVYARIRDMWDGREVDLCWWTEEAKEELFDESVQLGSVEFEETTRD